MPTANPPAPAALAAIASIVTRNHLPGTHTMATALTNGYVAGLLASAIIAAAGHQIRDLG